MSPSSLPNSQNSAAFQYFLALAKSRVRANMWRVIPALSVAFATAGSAKIESQARSCYSSYSMLVQLALAAIRSGINSSSIIVPLVRFVFISWKALRAPSANVLTSAMHSSISSRFYSSMMP